MVLDRSFFGHGPGRLRSVGYYSVPLGSYVNSIKPISTSNITLSEAWALFFEDPTDQDNSRFCHINSDPFCWHLQSKISVKICVLQTLISGLHQLFLTLSGALCLTRHPLAVSFFSVVPEGTVSLRAL